ncbi:hypothetical protein ASG44_11290 [Methylophilus sp. Leaf459]|nr:hypothetical protein ASG34_09760 [Methylophilus sp. Leaf416]KQT56001.1 hypothetical protein ASG44_11290 [Methylophilus sp. Leaf459]
MRLEAANAQTSRRPLLWISLLLTVVLVYWQWSAEQDAVDDTVVADSSLAHPAPAKKQASAAAVPATVTVPELQTNSAHDQAAQPAAAERSSPVVLPRKLPAKVSHALFDAHEWLPPPVKPQPPPPPQAPPVPYTYVGSMQDVPEGSTVILMQQKKVLMPRLKSQVTAQWRLDSEDAQSVYFTYLPLNQAVVLSKAKTAAAGQRQSVADTEDNIPLEQ